MTEQQHLTHIDEKGDVRMVDVSEKDITKRVAVAEGFISPMSRHFCGECNRMRLTADGKLRPCLFSDREYDIRGILRSGKPEEQIDRDLADAFRTAIGAKPDDHDDITGTERRMSQIGG